MYATKSKDAPTAVQRVSPSGELNIRMDIVQSHPPARARCTAAPTISSSYNGQCVPLRPRSDKCIPLAEVQRAIGDSYK
jgi:hypothetical protein